MEKIAEFMQAKQIDSFQKLRILLFLHEHIESGWTYPQIAKRLFLGEGPLVEEVMADLQAAGLVECRATGCRLRDEASVEWPLQHLVKMCEDPLARQEILDRVRTHPEVSSAWQAGVS